MNSAGRELLFGLSELVRALASWSVLLWVLVWVSKLGALLALVSRFLALGLVVHWAVGCWFLARWSRLAHWWILLVGPQ